MYTDDDMFYIQRAVSPLLDQMNTNKEYRIKNFTAARDIIH